LLAHLAVRVSILPAPWISFLPWGLSGRAPFPDGVVDPNAERPFFGVAKSNRHGVGREIDVELNQTRCAEIVQMDRPGFV